MSEAATIAARHLLVLRRNPILVLAYLAGPIGLVLMFGYVFGGAISGGEARTYREALVPGAFILTAGTSLVIVAGDTARDLREGLTQRLRTMPVSRLAILLGHTLAQSLMAAICYLLMAGIGLLIGWRWHTGIAGAAGGFALLLLFGHALAWFGVLLGLVIDETVIQQLSSLLLGFVMLSNALIPVETMPTGLRVVAEWNPFSAAVGGLRSLLGNGPPPDGPWPLANPVLATVVWSCLLLMLAVPVAVRRLSRVE